MRPIILSLAFFSAVSAVAQDQLFKKDNSKTEVKVLEVTPDEVKYKLFSYQDGPVIRVPKNEVALIIYQNGTHQTFNVPVPQQPVLISGDERMRNRIANRRYADSVKLVKYHEVTATKNLVSLNLLETFNGGLGVSYLREFSNGLFHVYAPVSVGISEPFFNQPSNTVFGSLYYDDRGIRNFKFNRKTIEGGLGIHFNSNHKKAVTHVIGPYIGMAQYTGSYEYYKSNRGSYTSIEHNKFVMNRYTFMLDNGFLFRVHKNFNMLLLGGFGYRSDDYLANDPKEHMRDYSGFLPLNFVYAFPINTFKLNFSVGYRF